MGLALEKLPAWPRMMKRATAAAFCDLSEAEREVNWVSADREGLVYAAFESKGYVGVEVFREQ